MGVRGLAALSVGTSRRSSGTNW